MSHVDLRAGSLNCISLCTGGGGLDLGVELAIPSARVVAMVEREAFACAHLVAAIEEGLLASAPIHTDVRTFPGRRFRGCVDGIFGGIPCQPYSHAGERRGAADPRDLWGAARRTVVQSGAWWVLIENVSGMLTAAEGETPGAERVCRDLWRLGFDVEGGLFEAPEVGGTDERQRLFILGVNDRLADRYCEHDDGTGIKWARGRRQPADRRGELADASSPGPSLAEQPGQPGPAERGLGARSTTAELRGAHVADASGGGCPGRPDGEVWRPFERAPVERPDSIPLWPPRPNDISGWRNALDLWPEAQPAVRGVADGLAGRVDRLRMLGNGVKPLQAAYALRTLAARLAARSAGAALLVRMMEVA